MILRVLAVDTAHRNLGLTVVTADGPRLQVDLMETFKPPDSVTGIFMPALLCSKRVRAVLQEHPVDVACVEGAALSGRHGMVSVGAVHGTVLQAVVDARVPFVYPPPNKMKLFVTGSGIAEKRDIKRVVLEVFGSDLATGGRKGKPGVSKRVVMVGGVPAPALDSNRADALGLALMGLWFGYAIQMGVPQAMALLPAALQSWGDAALAVFTAEKPLNKAKERPGILHRPGDMFWIPAEKREVLRGI